jgi:hypothetical protein
MALAAALNSTIGNYFIMGYEFFFKYQLVGLVSLQIFL